MVCDHWQSMLSTCCATELTNTVTPPWLISSGARYNEITTVIRACLDGNSWRVASLWQGQDELPLRFFFTKKTVLIMVRMWPFTGIGRESTQHKKWRHSWDRDEKCNQEILEGRPLQWAVGRLIIELIREQCHPNNTQANCFKISSCRGKKVHHLHNSSSPRELDV